MTNIVEHVTTNVDGDKIYDVKDENRVYPNFTRVNELKMVVAEKVFEVEEALANS